MQIIVDNNIRIISPEKEIKRYCIKELSIDNPQYEQNKRLGFPTYNIPSRLYWYEERGNDIIVPFGCINDLYKMFPIHEYV